MIFRTPPGEVDVLLVEPSVPDAELTLLALKESGVTHRIHVARNGREALEFLRRKGRHAERVGEPLPRLVLFATEPDRPDLQAFLHPLRTEAATGALPLVVLTTKCDAAWVEEGYRLGANSFAVKPSRPGNLPRRHAADRCVLAGGEPGGRHLGVGRVRPGGLNPPVRCASRSE